LDLKEFESTEKVSVNEIVNFCFAAHSVVPFYRGYLIRNVDELLQIEDADFARYSPAERAALLGRFAIMSVPTNLIPSKGFNRLTPKDRHLPSDH
jgi:hypothetical protein